jgi:hypothetical protein
MEIGLAKLIGECLTLAIQDVGDHYLRAFLHETAHNSFTNAARAACNQRHFPNQSLHICLSSPLPI